MKKLIIIAALVGAAQIAFTEEVSVFGAGDITSSSPYGLTENEQVLLANKKRIDNIQRDVEAQNQSITGLRTVLEGSTSQISKLEARISDLEIKSTGRVSKYANRSISVVTSDDIADIRRDIAELKAQIGLINQQLGINSSSIEKKK